MSNRALPSGHRALRLGRVHALHQIYLVTTVTWQRTPWFADVAIASAVAARHNDTATFAGARLLSWVLMPDHWHGLIALDEPVSLSCVVNRFKSISACESNRLMNRRGPVWSRAFHDRAIRRESDVATAHRYIAENPLRAGLCVCGEDYPFMGSVLVVAR